MIVVSVLGRKGGVGKTLISNTLAYGLGEIGYPVVLLKTDVRGMLPPQSAPGRPYWMLGIGGTPEEAAKQMWGAFNQTKKIPQSILIVDGGANRRAVDHLVVSLSQMVIIPVYPGPEDIEVAEADFKEFRQAIDKSGETEKPQLFQVLNRWPGDKRRKDSLFANQWVTDYLERSQGRRLSTVIPDMPSAMNLAYFEREDVPVPVRVNARLLASEVREKGDFHEPPNFPNIDEEVDEAVEQGKVPEENLA